MYGNTEMSSDLGMYDGIIVVVQKEKWENKMGTVVAGQEWVVGEVCMEDRMPPGFCPVKWKSCCLMPKSRAKEAAAEQQRQQQRPSDVEDKPRLSQEAEK